MGAWRGLGRVGMALLTLSVVLALWYVLTSLTAVISPARFPSPGEVAAAWVQITSQGYADAKLWRHVVQSSTLVLYGFLAAVAVGVPMGFCG